MEKDDVICIIVSILPHEQQRYDTVGDYYLQPAIDQDGIPVGRVLRVNVSNMGNFYYHALIVIHELVEYALLRMKGVSVEQVDRFDMEFEKDKILGKHKDYEEPGDCPSAPYRKEHQFATMVEKLTCRKLGILWKGYTAAVDSYRGKWSLWRQVQQETDEGQEDEEEG